MQEAYIKLCAAALLPVLAATILFLLDKHTPFHRWDNKIKQCIYGIVFGCLAIIGTEWGIPINGAIANCRDGAVLIGGLMFGSPAGIIAGLIGGIERWFSSAGDFTRIACSSSTIIAGIYAACLRKFMFENRRPGWFLSLSVGVVMEIFHLTMVFITNLSTPEKAMEVVKVCTAPLVLTNSIAVMLAAIVLAALAKEPILQKKSSIRISQTIQKRMLLTVVIAFFITTGFVYQLQYKLAEAQVENLLSISLNDMTADIEDASDENLLSLTHKIVAEATSDNLEELAEKYDVAEISMINKKGIIDYSSVDYYVGYDMTTGGKQTEELLQLLGDTKEIVQGYQHMSSEPHKLRKYAGIKTEMGFIEVGYDAARFQKDIDENVIGITKNRHVGKTGYLLILDENYSVVSAPAGSSLTSLQEHFKKSGIGKANETFSIRLNDVPCFARYCTTEGYYILSVLPEDEAFKMHNIAVYVNAYMEILVFAMLFSVIYLLIRQVVVKQIKSINKSLGKIANGDLSETVDVRSNEEFASLSDDINSTVNTLKHYIDEASARIDEELEFAKNIQMSALPNSSHAFPKRKDFEIHAQMNPAREVGGDFYDFYMTNQDTLHFLIADVSGKGIPAAMFMMRAKTELRTLAEAELPLYDVFTRGNNALYEGNSAGMFVTAWQGCVDLETGVLQYANAGHNPPLVCHANGEFEFLRSRASLVLAGMPGVPYKTQEIQLEPGDTVFLYTDGVTEATNADTELYGDDRLKAALNSQKFDSVKDLCSYVKADVDAFVGDAPQFDDITMVAFRFQGSPSIPTIHFDEATIENINDVTDFIEEELGKLNCSMKTIVQINVAIDELFSNIVHYGYPNGKKGPVTVKLIEKEAPHSVIIRFEDNGVPYNPLQKEDPDITLSAEARQVGGLGIFMVKQTMDDFKYKYEKNMNITTITKILEE